MAQQPDNNNNEHNPPTPDQSAAQESLPADDGALDTEQGPKPEPRHTETLSDLEGALVHFVHSFEASAERWEQTVYPFLQSFENSAKRWERMVYPAIIVFGIMGLSGFWLIASLTKDVHEMARNVDPKMAANLGSMSSHMSVLSKNVELMSDDIEQMTVAIVDMHTHIKRLDGSILAMKDDMGAISTKLDSLPPMLLNIGEMNQSMKGMTMSTGTMSRDLWQMNQAVGRPFAFMNQFIPW